MGSIEYIYSVIMFIIGKLGKDESGSYLNTSCKGKWIQKLAFEGREMHKGYIQSSPMIGFSIWENRAKGGDKEVSMWGGSLRGQNGDC
jgi:hypothetical protein